MTATPATTTDEVVRPFATRGRPSTLANELIPTIGVDPGGRWTALAVVVSGHCVEGVVVRNTSPAVRVDHTLPADHPLAQEPPPDVLYETRVRAALLDLVTRHDEGARRWWATRGHIVPATASPLHVAVEKTNPPQEKPRLDGRCPGYRQGTLDDHRGCWHVTADVAGPLLACAAVEATVRTYWGPWRTSRVRPHSADDRWTKVRGGTGQMEDYYPSSICGGDAEMTHVRAAWQIGADSADDYRVALEKLGMTLVPPHEGLPLVPIDGLLRVAPDERLILPPPPGIDYHAESLASAVA